MNESDSFGFYSDDDDDDAMPSMTEDLSLGSLDDYSMDSDNTDLGLDNDMDLNDDMDLDDETTTGGSSTSDGVSVDSGELSEFISNGKSGDIDRILDAFEWLNGVKASLKPGVRASNKEAIKAAIEVDKAEGKVADKYDRFSIAGALDSMTDDMTEEQLDRYNSLIGKDVLYFNASDMNSEAAKLYNSMRRGF